MGLVIAEGGGGWKWWKDRYSKPLNFMVPDCPEFFCYISKADFQTIRNQIRVRLCSFCNASVNSSMHWFGLGLGPFVRWLCHDALAEELLTTILWNLTSFFGQDDSSHVPLVFTLRSLIKKLSSHTFPSAIQADKASAKSSQTL